MGELAGTRAGGESALYSTVGGVGGSGVPGSGMMGLLGVTKMLSYWLRCRLMTGVVGSACESGVGSISDSISDLIWFGVLVLVNRPVRVRLECLGMFYLMGSSTGQIFDQI